MIKKIAKQLFDFQCKCGVLEERDRRLYEYAYNLFICKVVAYLGIIIASIWLGNLKEILVFLSAFIPLRQYVGGFHLKKAERCIVASGVMVCMAGQYLNYFPMPTVITFFLWIVAIGLISVLAPIGCINKKLDTVEIEVYRKRSRILLGMECLLVIFTHYMGFFWLSKSIIVAQIILAVSLLLGWKNNNFYPKTRQTNLGQE